MTVGTVIGFVVVLAASVVLKRAIRWYFRRPR